MIFTISDLYWINKSIFRKLWVEGAVLHLRRKLSDCRHWGILLHVPQPQPLPRRILRLLHNEKPSHQEKASLVRSNQCADFSQSKRWPRNTLLSGTVFNLENYILGRQFVKKVLKMFSESSTGCWANTAAAVLPKQARGTLRKHFTTPFSQPDDPDCTMNLILYRHRLTSIDLSLDNREGSTPYWSAQRFPSYPRSTVLYLSIK